MFLIFNTIFAGMFCANMHASMLQTFSDFACNLRIAPSSFLLDCSLYENQKLLFRAVRHTERQTHRQTHRSTFRGGVHLKIGGFNEK